MKRLTLLLAFALIVSGCGLNVGRVKAYAFTKHGITLTTAEARPIVKELKRWKQSPCAANYAERHNLPTKGLARCTDVEAVIRWHWPAAEQQNAIDVAWCETNHNNAAVGAAGEKGFLQVMPQWATTWGWVDDPGKPLIPAMGYTHAQLQHDPWAAGHVAYEIWRHEGWQPWTCKRVLR